MVMGGEAMAVVIMAEDLEVHLLITTEETRVGKVVVRAVATMAIMEALLIIGAPDLKTQAIICLRTSPNWKTIIEIRTYTSLSACTAPTSCHQELRECWPSKADSLKKTRTSILCRRCRQSPHR